VKKNILIIGNQGYVGTKLTQVIDYSKYNVSCIDIGLFKNCNLYRSTKEKCFKQNYSDVRRIKDNILKNQDIIIYLAAISNDPMGEKFKKITNEINYKSCINIAKRAKKFGTKSFIFASSCSVYGTEGAKMKKENNKLNPLTVYAKTKVLSEKKLKLISSNKFKVLCLRFATACGESPRLRLDLVLNDFVFSALKTKEIKILSDGSPLRPLIDVKDMALAIQYGFDFKKLKNFTCVNAGSNKWNFKVIDLAKKVSAVLGGIKINFASNSPADKRSYMVNFSEFKKIAPKFYPKTKIEDTIIQLKNKLVYKNVKKINKKNYIRLDVLNKKINSKYIKT